jgi:hypothetical protein
MTKKQDEVARRAKVALEAIRRTLDTEAGEYGAGLFASHHLQELDHAYWQKHLGTPNPEPAQLIGLLDLKSHWSIGDDGIDNDGIDTFDFSLPGEVSDYVLSVRFDEQGEVEDVTMES